MENSNIKDLFMSFGVTKSIRINKKQKIRYLTLLKYFFEKNGYATIQILKHKIFRKKSFIEIVGNIDTADVILATYYDTPVFKPFEKYEPFNEEKLKRVNAINYIVMMIFTISIFFVYSYFIALPIYQDGNFGFKDIFASIASLILLFFLVKISKYGGIPSMGNLVRNTSSVVVLLQIAQELDKSDKKKVAFAFVDYGCEDYLGYHTLSLSFEGKKKQKIYLLDSVGYGNIQAHEETEGLLPSYFDQVTYIYGEKTKEKVNYEDSVIECVKILQNQI